MLLARIAAAAFSLPLVLLSQTSADAQVKPGLERLYVIDCGHADIPDISRWTPGANAGVSAKFSDNCYLIKHAQGWMLWDTGLADSIATSPPPAQPGAPVWRRATTLAAELEKLGVKPGDIKFVAVSHTHGDHAGNVELFPQQMLLVQKAEYDWPGADGKPRFVASHPVTKLEGDHDVFGDGTVTIISTPGHTPGHQSLMVKLPETGVILLSGDAVHFRENWDLKRIPGFNVDQAKSATSMQRLADLVAEHKAQLWINHDKAQSDTMKRSPQFYQ